MATTAKKRRRETVTRIATSLRIAPPMFAQLQMSAQQHGRSFSGEIETRLAYSFRSEEALTEGLAVAFGAEGSKLLLLLGRLIRHVPAARGIGVEDTWRSDPTSYALFEQETLHALSRLRPPGEPAPLDEEILKNRVDRLLVALDEIEPPTEWKEEAGQ
jgi:hypothetical protein